MSVRGDVVVVFVNIVGKGFEKGDKEGIKIVLDGVRGELLL